MWPQFQSQECPRTLQSHLRRGVGRHRCGGRRLFRRSRPQRRHPVMIVGKRIGLLENGTTGRGIWSDSWVDFDFGSSTVLPILLGQMEIWQNEARDLQIQNWFQAVRPLSPLPVPLTNSTGDLWIFS